MQMIPPAWVSGQGFGNGLPEEAMRVETPISQFLQQGQFSSRLPMFTGRQIKTNRNRR